MKHISELIKEVDKQVEIDEAYYNAIILAIGGIAYYGANREFTTLP